MSRLDTDAIDPVSLGTVEDARPTHASRLKARGLRRGNGHPET